MPVRFGIRGKIALLVVVAAAVAAYLVAFLLSRAADQLLRAHELVDLGDEAHVRASEITDQVDGLREDATVFAYSPEFHEALPTSDATPEHAEALRQIARGLCRRYWKRHLRIDVFSLDETGPFSEPLVIEKKARISPDDVWLPNRETLASARGTLISDIRRVEIEHLDGRKSWEPVIWAVAPLAPFDSTDTVGSAPLLRILMTLDEPGSSRHFFTLANAENELLVRPDEFAGEGTNNDAVFKAIARDREVQERFRAVPPEGQAGFEKPQIDRLVIRKEVPLEVDYRFLEGIPGPKLAAAIDAEEPERFDPFFEKMRIRFREDGRIGGLRNEVKELRLLASSPEKLVRLQEEVTAMLEERYGDQFDGLDWRKPVVCDEIHAWAVRLGLGTLDEQSRYLLIYAVMADELSSSIRQELSHLRRIALVIAVFAGVVAFLISMYFVRPLQRMTDTAQRVTGAASERLAGQLRQLTDLLPINRKDEVGDIAKASKRLFEEIIENQEQLEERVRERTARLAQANLDLEAANEQLTSLSREKDAFVAKVSHDLRQPLNAIFLQVEALKLSELDPQQSTDVAKIHDHAARELGLVNDILEYQKIIMGAEVLSRDEIEIASLVEDLTDAFGKVAEAKGLTFATICDPEIGTMVTDGKRLRQVLDNLVGNACKFTRGGRVQVEFYARSVSGEDWIEMIVDDTGRGMSEEEQAKAFVPFVSNKKANEGGTGLGLSICKELCHQLGGKIGFVSELGKGTRFTVMLPRTAPESSAREGDSVIEHAGSFGFSESGRPADHEETAPVSPPKNATALVVDDYEGTREFIRRLLEGEGYTVVLAEDGKGCREMVKRHSPDVITLDVVMPDEDGWQVLADLKQDPETDSIPVIMVSVMAENAEGLSLGVADYLVKPIDRKHLIKSVNKAAAGQADGNAE